MLAQTHGKEIRIQIYMRLYVLGIFQQALCEHVGAPYHIKPPQDLANLKDPKV
ncbi:Uncharacterised protein [Chlamydia trachomatis]|nr:Uncharacterised protein [Chlamydia trachomatis]